MELVERIGSGRYGEGLALPNALGALRAVKIVRRAEFDDDRPYERELNGIRKFELISRTHEGFINILPVAAPKNTSTTSWNWPKIALPRFEAKYWGLGRVAVAKTRAPFGKRKRNA